MKICAYYDRKNIFGEREYSIDEVNSKYVYDFDLKKMLSVCFRKAKDYDYSAKTFKFQFFDGSTVRWELFLECKQWDGDDVNDVYSVQSFELGRGKEPEKKMGKKAIAAWVELHYKLEQESAEEQKANSAA